VSKFEKVLKGLQILAKYPEPCIQPAHDELLAGCDGDLSADDAASMKALGWRDRGEDGWVIFT